MNKNPQVNWTGLPRQEVDSCSCSAVMSPLGPGVSGLPSEEHEIPLWGLRGRGIILFLGKDITLGTGCENTSFIQA